MDEAAVLIIDNGRGELLLQHRDDNLNISEPNKWCLFGGMIEKGETSLEAVIRELKEELNYVIDISKIHYLKQIKNVHVYWTIDEKLRDNKVSVYEGQEAGWFSQKK